MIYAYGGTKTTIRELYLLNLFLMLKNLSMDQEKEKLLHMYSMDELVKPISISKRKCKLSQQLIEPGYIVTSLKYQWDI